MPPVRIKYYGLISMTKHAYLLTLRIVAGAVFLLVLLLAFTGILPPLDTMWSSRHQVSDAGFMAWFNNYFYWFSAVCLIAQGIDTICTLLLFAKRERELNSRE